MLSKLLRIFGLGPKAAPETDKARKPRKAKPKVAPERIGELGEHKINIQLDQLPKACKFVSDLMVRNPKSRTGFAQIDHVVVTPYGLFVIETKNYNGEIKGGREDRQWSVGGRFKMYNPLKQNQGHIKALENVLANHAPLSFISLVSFTMRCRFSIDPALRKIESDELVVYDVELSEFIQRKLLRQKAIHAEPLLSDAQILHIHQALIEANVTDPALRREHVLKLQGNAAGKP
ncbi:nuclease-related domain-containing protein [Paenibacillus sp.]|uniref:nuclease-related domain-containing protein n=1 Tax=Paenibacillus sp. TaxID=58172 RepID=UPI002D255A1B|nr:nuclease-related domain-containing protein [Paenibacillus sp.]HZG88053.1 nuclease-related domain-containing protein [Paenibacillus sp.]